MGIRIEKTAYKGLNDCITMRNDSIVATVSTAIGPRILEYGFIDGQNFMCNVDEQIKHPKNDEWQIFGGHRLWHSPEVKPRTYVPDNTPIDYELLENGVCLTQPVEPWVNIQKVMKVTMAESGSLLTVDHTLINRGAWNVRLSLWALTVVSEGGMEIVPQNDKPTGLLPNRMISLWPYTKMNDPRITWGQRYIFLKQDPNNKNECKFGMSNHKGWAAYQKANECFVKRFDPIEQAEYPDYGSSNYETYTTDYMLEMESLSPLTELMPNQALHHQERWYLAKGIPSPRTESDVDLLSKKLISNFK